MSSICERLAELGLGQYADALEEKAITLDLASNLTNDD